MFCFNCGKNVEGEMKFCPNCGIQLVVSEVKEEIENTEEMSDDKNSSSIIRCEYTDFSSTKENIKQKGKEKWRSLNFFDKVMVIAVSIIGVFVIIGLLCDITKAWAIALIQLILACLGWMQIKGKIKNDKKWLTYVLLFVGIILVVPYFDSFGTKESNGDTIVKNMDNDDSFGESMTLQIVEATNTPMPTQGPQKVNIEIEVDCEANLFFNTYDLKIMFDGSQIGRLEHGETNVFSVEVEEGTYTLEFQSVDSGSVNGMVTVTVEQESTFKYKISCHGSEVRIAEIEKIKAPVAAPEYENMSFDEVKQKFINAGFTNVKTKEIKDLAIAERDKSELVSDISVDGASDYGKEDSFFEDVAVVIIYRTPQKIKMVRSDDDYYGMNYKEAKKELEALGFINIEIKSETVTSAYYENEQVYDVTIASIFGFEKGEECEYDSTIRVKYYIVNEPTPTPTPGPTYYSTNTYDVAKEGNMGIFSYKSKGGTYDVYWIINFDEGYVYWFTEGNGESTCDKVAIVSGDLNDKVAVTWHMGGDEWTWYLHFKYVGFPETLVVNDHYGTAIEFGTTDLDDALKLRDTKKIKEY